MGRTSGRSHTLHPSTVIVSGIYDIYLRGLLEDTTSLTVVGITILPGPRPVIPDRLAASPTVSLSTVYVKVVHSDDGAVSKGEEAIPQSRGYPDSPPR